MTEKHCSRCARLLPIEEYTFRRVRGKRYRYSECRACRKALNTKWLLEKQSDEARQRYIDRDCARKKRQRQERAAENRETIRSIMSDLHRRGYTVHRIASRSGLMYATVKSYALDEDKRICGTTLKRLVDWYTAEIARAERAEHRQPRGQWPTKSTRNA